jgi:hypothetical protein
MRKMSRRELLRLLGAAGSLLGLGVAAGCGRSRSGNMMGGGMMGVAGVESGRSPSRTPLSWWPSFRRTWRACTSISTRAPR